MSIIRKADNVYVEYKFPNGIKNLFTKEFLQLFKTKLDEIFNKDNKELCDWDYFNMESTGGWFDALKYACENHNYKHMGIGILRYYNKLPWYDSDLFDGTLCNVMVDKLGIKKVDIRDYYNDDEYDYTEIEGIDYKWKLKAQYNSYKVYNRLYYFEDGFNEFKGDKIHRYK